MEKISLVRIICLLSLLISTVVWINISTSGEPFTIARLKYSGGGDWYIDRTSLPNLLEQLRERVGMNTTKEEVIVTASDSELFSYPLIYLTGHGTVRFSDMEVKRLREYFKRGGVLWADDNYGLDETFREEIKKIFPNHPLQELKPGHPIFSSFYRFEYGLPKIHKHDEKPPQLFGVYYEGRIAVLYTYETDIGDGIESEGVHPKDTPFIREEAMKMAINIIVYILSS
jgi:hypothetical protein